jgi:hypothetical protein
MQDKVFETLADILLRLSSLEKVLIDKGVITKEDYVESLKGSANEFQKLMEQMISEQKHNKVLQ